MSSRTEGTWFVYRDNPNLICTAKNEIIADTYGTDFDTETDRANAAFIVRAVNSHEQLVAALRETLAEAVGRYEQIVGESPDESDWCLRARAALAAAEA